MRVLFLFIGEAHHLFHSLPIAAEMKIGFPEFHIEIAISGDEHASCLAAIQASYPVLRDATVTILRPSIWRRMLNRTPLGRSRMRVPTLIAALSYLRGFDAIVVPERTTTFIRKFLGDRTRLIFTPHGAGDRAIMLDPRDALFDFVLVAGEKSERRLLDAGTIRPGDYAVTGYVKLDYLQRMPKRASRSFSNDRPTVLYAPHFRRALSSWDRFAAELIERFRAQDDFNLVVAPHVRLFHAAHPQKKAKWQALAQPGRILVDTGSPKLLDMSYLHEADIYLGDVSSQVYEFLARPRPCVFLNGHAADWRGNPDYAFWNLGEVVDDPAAVLPALARAAAMHPTFEPLQRRAVLDSFGEANGAAARSAAAIATFLKRPPPSQDSRPSPLAPAADEPAQPAFARVARS